MLSGRHGSQLAAAKKCYVELQQRPDGKWRRRYCEVVRCHPGTLQVEVLGSEGLRPGRDDWRCRIALTASGEAAVAQDTSVRPPGGG